jgi:hypothetical protein
VYINSVMSVLRLHVVGYFTEKWLYVMKNITFSLDSIFVWFRYRRLFFFLVWYRNYLGCMSGANFCCTVFLFLNMGLYLIKPELSISFVACGIERMYSVTVFY